MQIQKIDIKEIVANLREFKRPKKDALIAVRTLDNRVFNNVDVVKRIFSTLKTQKVKEVIIQYNESSITVSATGHSWNYELYTITSINNQ